MSNETKQTAVDWLLNEWPVLNSQLPQWLIEQAKEMEKEQLIDFAIKCMFNSDDIGSNLRNHFIQKYNETYGGNK